MVKTMEQFEFAQIYADHKERVWRLVSRYAASQQDREDLFQEVFLRIHKALPKFRGDADLGTWIYRITVNTSLNYLKRQKRYAGLKDMLSKLRFIEEEEEKKDKEDKKLSKPLERLNPLQRMILILAEVEEKKLEEIAGILNIPVGTVKSNLHRAREIVKKELNKKDGRI
jgi:RNA polymerase sigma-70 factor (ECF subfamily)